MISREDPYKFLGACVVAELAGKAVLSALQASLEASIAKTEARRSKQACKKSHPYWETGGRRVAAENAHENSQIVRHLVEKEHLPVKDVLTELPGVFSRLPEKLELDPNVIEATLRTYEKAKLATLDALQAKLDGLEQATWDSPLTARRFRHPESLAENSDSDRANTSSPKRERPT